MNGWTDQQPDIIPVDYTIGGRDWPGQCSYGRFQSPVDITDYPENPQQLQVVSAGNSTFGPYVAHVWPIPTSSLDRIQAGGFVTWMTFDTLLTETFNGISLNQTLLDVRITTPAEHTINGIRYPLALHMVYAVRHPDTNYFTTAFLQVMFREGARSQLLDTLENMEGDADFSEAFPEDGVIDDYYTYAGSINVPLPTCQESYTWIIPNYVKEASSDQIALWQGRYMSPDYYSGHGNYRDTKPLGNRMIFHYVPAEQSQSFLV